jgi:hypothetical protein
MVRSFRPVRRSLTVPLLVVVVLGLVGLTQISTAHATATHQTNTHATTALATLPSSHPTSPSHIVHAFDSACSACCGGTGTCSYEVKSAASTTAGDATTKTVTKHVQCCGVLNETPKCCPVNRGLMGPMPVCSTDEDGYVCKDSRQ